MDVSNTFPSDTDVAGPDTTLWEMLTYINIMALKLGSMAEAPAELS